MSFASLYSRLRFRVGVPRLHHTPWFMRGLSIRQFPQISCVAAPTPASAEWLFLLKPVHEVAFGVFVIAVGLRRVWEVMWNDLGEERRAVVGVLAARALASWRVATRVEPRTVTHRYVVVVRSESGSFF